MQANPNMGWGNPAPGNTNMNWGPAMQAPPPGNTTPGWVAPAGNTGATSKECCPGTNPGWAATQGWVAPPAQGPVPGTSWGPPSGNAGPAPPAVPGPAQGNTNQGGLLHHLQTRVPGVANKTMLVDSFQAKGVPRVEILVSVVAGLGTGSHLLVGVEVEVEVPDTLVSGTWSVHTMRMVDVKRGHAVIICIV
ncbi:UNVERIFIED_CONTAM: hypothetical protein Sradi_2797700 [Sesamum radiatum]|uniref:Uncharacterized protein n=1 Tax=Sesamum radiatum TaxID=300843 RepID=A0AAW2RW12_SESRA